MAILLPSVFSFSFTNNNNNKNNSNSSSNSNVLSSLSFCSGKNLRVVSHVCTSETACVEINKSMVKVSEVVSEEEMWAAACLRVRSFYSFKDDSFDIQDHRKYLAECEFEALKERIAGKRTEFGRVSCINATLTFSHMPSSSDDLCSACKFSDKGDIRVFVGSLDINQCIKLPDEITGKRPQGIGGNFARAYLTNVCVAKELQRNGLGYMLISKSQEVAEDWGISDLYVHVAIDNEPAKNISFIQKILSIFVLVAALFRYGFKFERKTVLLNVVLIVIFIPSYMIKVQNIVLIW